MEKENKKKSTVKKVIKSAFDTALNRIPPHSIDAEIAVLGAMMLSREAVYKVISLFAYDTVKSVENKKNKEDSSKVFYDPKHQEIYKAILELDRMNVAPDIISLTEHLKKMGSLELAGGTYYISEINRLTPTYAHVESHARLVQEYYFRRILIDISEEVLEDCYSETTDILEVVDETEAKIFAVAEKRISKNFQSMRSLATDTYKLIEKMMSDDKSEGGVSTGYTILDRILNGGLQKSDLCILAARPSMGKTAFALALTFNAANNKIPVAFFSLEMNAKQLVMRMLSSYKQINVKEIITYKRRNEISEIIDGMGKLAELPIYFDDSSTLSIMEMRAKCRRLKVEKDVQLIVVDYLQLIQSIKAESREREIAIISSTLKQIARELEVPVLALAQLNRSVETRTGKDRTPLLSDLRESGSIEQDADVVMFIHRPEYYEKNEEEVVRNGWKNLAQIIVGKHRNGATGIADLFFNPNFGRFGNRETNIEEPPRFANRNTDAQYTQTVGTQPNYSHSNIPTSQANEPEDVVF